jgi:hypothetical protein
VTYVQDADNAEAAGLEVDRLVFEGTDAVVHYVHRRGTVKHFVEVLVLADVVVLMVK